VYLVKRGVQIASRPTWAFPGVPTEGGAFWCWAATTSLFSPINRGKRVEQKCSALLVFRILSKLVRKIVFVEKIQVEVLP